MPQHIVVQAYNSEWPQRYEEERARIMPILRDNCIAIYHIGSTSVPKLAAKPVIDIMIVVKNLKGVDAVSAEFSAIGYEWLGEYGIAGRRYLRKGGDERTHQIHIFQAEDWQNISRHLAFRDYLRSHEEARSEYAKLKKVLAQRFPYDIDRYGDGKEKLVGRLETQALSQFDGTWDRLFIAARQVQCDRKISPLIEAGSVAAALLTSAGNIYVGVCIDTACSLGMCAERSAIAQMVTHGESQVTKVLAVMSDGKVGMPCGACRELMMQLDKAAGDIEILTNYDSKKIVALKELMPNWWYEKSFPKER